MLKFLGKKLVIISHMTQKEDGVCDNNAVV